MRERERESYRWTGRLTDGQVDSQKGRWTDSQMEIRWTDGQTDSQTAS